jgi:hypothetical protein
LKRLKAIVGILIAAATIGLMAAPSDASAGWFYGALRNSSCGVRILVVDSFVQGQYVPLSEVEIEPTTTGCRTLHAQLIFNDGSTRCVLTTCLTLLLVSASPAVRTMLGMLGQVFVTST